jgi:hypothetical protein
MDVVEEVTVSDYTAKAEEKKSEVGMRKQNAEVGRLTPDCCLLFSPAWML